jgi:negative regulator of sigma E activity
MSTEATSATDGPAEQLSALLDGELPPEQTDFLLKRLGRDAELRATLARYQLVGDTLRGERVRARPDFMLRVSAAIAAEPPLAAPAVRPVRGRSAWATWLKPVAGLAVAATVASVAVVVMQRDPVVAPAATIANVSAPVDVPAPSAVAPAPTLAAGSLTGEPASYVTPPAARGAGVIPPAQLVDYVVAHSEYSSTLGGRNAFTVVAGDPSAESLAGAPAGTSLRRAPMPDPGAPGAAAEAPVIELR